MYPAIKSVAVSINNKINILRWQAYGLPDDDYFSLRMVNDSGRTMSVTRCPIRFVINIKN